MLKITINMCVSQSVLAHFVAVGNQKFKVLCPNRELKSKQGTECGVKLAIIFNITTNVNDIFISKQIEGDSIIKFGTDDPDPVLKLIWCFARTVYCQGMGMLLYLLIKFPRFNH